MIGTALKAVLIFISIVSTGLCFAQEDEHPRVTTNSEAFVSSYDESLKRLMDDDFEGGLESPELGAVTPQEFQALLQAVKNGAQITGVNRGEPNTIYDVILQPGHYNRKTGAVGTSGKLVSEQNLVAYITGSVAATLRASHSLKVLVVSADEYIRDDPKTSEFDGLQSKIFLAIHADGSNPQCKTGPSLAYYSSNSTLAMHAIGWGLGQALGYRYEEFRKDGFTVNAARYYMFSKVRAPVMTGLLEVGELTCPPIEERLVSSANRIAANIAKAIAFVLDTQ
jgi:N-acetylmuramoyl-L-alanine amidase